MVKKPVFRDYHRTVVGYHGTRKKTALEIVAGKREFKSSKNEDDWLGHGTYFWEYAPKRAWNWARKQYPNVEIAVLGSMIRLGNCLDLVDPDNTKLVVDLHRRLVSEVGAVGGTLRKNYKARKYLDCQVFEYAYAVFEDEGERIDTVRGVYVPTQSKDRLWERSWLFHETHLQLCVRNPECILGTWLLKPLEE